MKITPFNFLAATVIVIYGYSLFAGRNGDFSVVRGGLLLVLLLLFFVMDLIFRRRVASTKRLWIIEITLIILAAVFIVLFNVGL